MAQVAERPDCRNLSWQRAAVAAVQALPGITDKTVRVFAAMAYRVDRDGLMWASQRSIAADAGMAVDEVRLEGTERNLRRRYLRPLERAGAISVYRRGDGRGRHTVWVIHNLAEKGSHGDSPFTEKGSHSGPRKGSHSGPIEEERNYEEGAASLFPLDRVPYGTPVPMPSWVRGALGATDDDTKSAPRGRFALGELVEAEP